MAPPLTAAANMLKEQYRKGLHHGVEMTLNQLDGRGALLPGSTYGGPLPAELLEWVDQIRDMLALEQEHRA